MKNFIKITDKDVAKNLSNSGYKYILENVGQNPIYVFLFSPEIKQIIETQYGNVEYVLENKLSFGV